jgi:FkbM family methyltransferase
VPIELIESHTLLPDLIRPGGLVVDCGANLGAFSRAMIERFGCRVLAFEASPDVFARLPTLRGFAARNVAVCGKDGPVSLAIDEDISRTAIATGTPGGRHTLEVPGRSLTGLLAEAGTTSEIEVLKLDIEGAELDVIDSLPDHLIRRIGQITVEFHDILGLYPAAEAKWRIARIARLGFRELYWSRARFTGDVLLVNGRRLGPFRHAVEQGLVRPARAAQRALVRRLGA